MNALQAQYHSWDSFRVAGTHFISLNSKDGFCHIYNELMESYGSYTSIESFKKMYKERGAELNLGK